MDDINGYLIFTLIVVFSVLIYVSVKHYMLHKKHIRLRKHSQEGIFNIQDALKALLAEINDIRAEGKEIRRGNVNLLKDLNLAQMALLKDLENYINELKNKVTLLEYDKTHAEISKEIRKDCNTSDKNNTSKLPKPDLDDFGTFNKNLVIEDIVFSEVREDTASK